MLPTALGADGEDDFSEEMSAPVCRNLGSGELLQIQCGRDVAAAAPETLAPTAPEPGKPWEASREAEDYSETRPTFMPDASLPVCFLHYPSLERRPGSPPYSCSVTGDSKAKAAEIDAARVVSRKDPICFDIGPSCFGAEGLRRAQAKAAAWSGARGEEEELRAAGSADALELRVETARTEPPLRADTYELPPRMAEDKNQPPGTDAQWLGRELRFEFDMTGSCPAMMSFLELRGYFEALAEHEHRAKPDVDVLIKPPVAAPRSSGHPRMPVTCSYNYRTSEWRMTGFFCESQESCYDQGELDLFADAAAQPDLRCRHFVRRPAPLFGGKSTWALEGTDCLGLSGRRKGVGAVPEFHLIPLGEGVFLRVTAEGRVGWQLLFAPTSGRG